LYEFTLLILFIFKVNITLLLRTKDYELRTKD
jgi:hypothetical protein